MNRIFISYSRDDAPELVENLYNDLERRGFKVWLDRKRMSNRGRTFLQEIRSAIDDCDHVVLVWGKTAPKKEYVRTEWEYARIAGKVIVPVVVGVSAESLPEEIGWFHAVITADARNPKDSFCKLARILSETPIELCPIVGVPEPPPRFRPRAEQLTCIRRLVFGDLISPKEITQGAGRVTVLHGMAGVGKSVLAAA